MCVRIKKRKIPKSQYKSITPNLTTKTINQVKNIIISNSNKDEETW